MQKNKPAGNDRALATSMRPALRPLKEKETDATKTFLAPPRRLLEIQKATPQLETRLAVDVTETPTNRVRAEALQATTDNPRDGPR